MIFRPKYLVLSLALLIDVRLHAEDGTTSPPAATTPSISNPTAQSGQPRKTEASPPEQIIQVRGDALRNASTATRTDAPMLQIPLSVQVVPAQVIDEQGDIRLKDVIRNVSSVLPSKTEQNGIQFETAYIRGFSQLTYIDGVQFYTLPTIDVAGVDRIEVVKGPSSSLFGAMEPGGMINVLPKLPEFTNQTTVDAEAGSHQFYRGELDSTGGITNTLAYRVEGSIQDNNSYRDFLHQKSEFIAPSLAWNPTDTTRVSTWLWYQELQRPQDGGVVFSFTGHPTGPITENLAGPNNPNLQDIRDTVYGLQADQDLTSNLNFEAKYLLHYFTGEENTIRWNAVTAANTVAPFFDGSQEKDIQNDINADLDYHAALGATHHELIGGVELASNDYHYIREVDTALPAININNPVYPTGPYNLTQSPTEQHTVTNDLGGYLQDQMDALHDRLHVLIGGRADHVEQSYTSFSNGKYYSQADYGFSGRAGILYDVTPWMSPYINVGRSFNPNTAGGSLTFTGTTLPPTSGRQIEAGVKFSTQDKRLSYSTDVYQITKDNVAVADPNHVGFSVNGGVMRSRGWENDVTGRITPELDVIGSYAYTKTDVLESTSLPVGASFINIPTNAFSLWVDYNFLDGFMKDFGAGLGCSAESRKAGDGANSFFLPGYARMDAGAWYTMAIYHGPKLKFQINVSNLFNTKYYESSANTSSVEPGAPLTLLGKVGITF
jgi:iron complex outermembrane receptor protein